MNAESKIEKIWSLLKEVPDPEIPVINVVELGIVRDVKFDNNLLLVTVTPTYSGCPATKTIEDDIRAKLVDNGYSNFQIETTYQPAWTTDWITEQARSKLRAYGIAPPEKASLDKTDLIGGSPKECPQCQSKNTSLISQFGSTPCKALYTCNECKEPFDYFKCH